MLAKGWGTVQVSVPFSSDQVMCWFTSGDVVGYEDAVAGGRPDEGDAGGAVVDDLLAGGVDERAGVVLALVAAAVEAIFGIVREGKGG